MTFTSGISRLDLSLKEQNIKNLGRTLSLITLRKPALILQKKEQIISKRLKLTLKPSGGKPCGDP